MNKKERILSYCMSHELAVEEILLVSGAGQQGHQTKSMSASITGAQKVQDWTADFSWDF